MYTGYKTLATIQLEHEFYPDNVCRDLEFVIPVETAKALASRRMLAKISDGILYLLAPLQAKGGAYLFPPVAAEQMILTLGIRLVNSGLVRLIQPAAPGMVSTWSNPAGNAAWQNSSVRLCGRIYEHAILNPARPLRVQLKKNGSGVEAKVIPSEAGIPGAQKITACSFDLKNSESGPYEISEGDLVVSAVFRQDELAAAGTDLLLRLRIDAFFAAPQTTKLVIAPAVLKNKWTYWLIRNAGAIAPADTYTIVDARPGVNGDKILFDPVDNSSKQAMATRLGLPVANLLGFQTRTVTSLKQVPLANLQLKKNADIMIKNLPNPALSSYSNDIMIPLQ